MSIPVPKVNTVDFETEGIEKRPQYPPKPVGVSIRRIGESKATYFAWGHPEKNNCTFQEARARVRDVYRSGEPMLFQNAKFDVDVADVHMGLKVPDWSRLHDTLYLISMYDPYAFTFSLKPSAERILGMKPEERDVVKQWVLKNVHEAKARPSEWGAYICRAPGDLVGRYANGDCLRTDKLFDFLYKEVVGKREMAWSYDRERHLMPILLRNEREGIRIDLPALERDYVVYCAALEKAENWLRKRLGAKELDFDKKVQVGNALNESGIVTDWVYTKKGKRSVAKDNMTVDKFNDPQVASVMGYRNRLKTCLGMYYVPWLAMAHTTGGTIHLNWNQVRQSNSDDKAVGARTSRMSCNPNLQAVVKNYKKAAAEGYVHPKFLNVPPLPLVRRYFLPDKGCKWLRRDYNQQELRILAHFEDGDLLNRYQTDPELDIHNEVQAWLKECGFDLPRDPVKILNFADIYGRGLATLSDELGVTKKEGLRIRNAKNKLLPGVATLAKDIVRHVKLGGYVRTWGGSVLYPEPAAFVKKFGRWMSFEYKMLNYIIQRSAAECTKESIINYDEHPKREGRFLLTVHDENDASAPKGYVKQESEVLRESMEEVSDPNVYPNPFDLPMRSDPDVGDNWAFV